MVSMATSYTCMEGPCIPRLAERVNCGNSAHHLPLGRHMEALRSDISQHMPGCMLHMVTEMEAAPEHTLKKTDATR